MNNPAAADTASYNAAPFTIADNVDTALTAMAAGARPIAGGTDLVVGARQGKSPLPTMLVAIDRVPGLAEVRVDEERVVLGSAITHARLMTDEIVVGDYTALADAAALVGSPATRNVGTLGGNVMNGSPAMDTGAPLVVLGAMIELTSQNGVRLLSPAELWTGPGTTAATSDELCTACILPRRPERSGSAYVRLEYRRAMEIAVVGASASVRLDDSGHLEHLSVALTAVAPTIVEVHSLEELVGRPVDERLLTDVARIASSQAQPISDLRAGADYRSHTVGVMARRAVDAGARRAAGQHIAVPVNRAEGVGRTEQR